MKACHAKDEGKEKSGQGLFAHGGARYNEATGRFTAPIQEDIREEDDDAELDGDDPDAYEDISSDPPQAGPAHQLQRPWRDEPAWKVGQQVVQNPTATFYIPTATGDSEVRRLKRPYDFNDRAEVAAANKVCRLQIWRRKKTLGMAGLRESTQDRHYTKEHDDMIIALHDEYAANNNGRQISFAQLTREFNQLFDGQDRTLPSITSHLHKVARLKTHRQSYRRIKQAG